MNIIRNKVTTDWDVKFCPLASYQVVAVTRAKDFGRYFCSLRNNPLRHTHLPSTLSLFPLWICFFSSNTIPSQPSTFLHTHTLTPYPSQIPIPSRTAHLSARTSNPSKVPRRVAWKWAERIVSRSLSLSLQPSFIALSIPLELLSLPCLIPLSITSLCHSYAAVDLCGVVWCWGRQALGWMALISSSHWLENGVHDVKQDNYRLQMPMNDFALPGVILSPCGLHSGWLS